MEVYCKFLNPALLFQISWEMELVGDAGLCLRIVFANEDWKLQMYSTSHFHSTSHELLCISTGSARLCFGHEDNPSNITPTVSAGDVIVVPAGVAHRLLEDIEGGFEMVGSYPKGKSWDMCYGKKGEEKKIKEIEKLGWWKRDPVFGDEGPALEV